ncbi:MAG: D-tyrosyl-tRNA(Tyr) deacylase [Saprospiraceae bacterium]|nr:D-tyrosyl-tRNA(Tyr) deacylase [Saprospiraceae bacterium]
MRVVIQRVSHAEVKVSGEISGEIDYGLLILLGICHADSEEDIDWLVNKIYQLRIFGDDAGVMNLSIQDIAGSFLVISQFTLHASTKKGNRPSYIKAAPAALAIPLYEKFLDKLNSVSGLRVEKGIFGADMKVSLINDGPVTIIMDSKNKE